MDNEALQPNSDEKALKVQSQEDFSIHQQLVFWLFISTFLLVLITTILLLMADKDNKGRIDLPILPVVAIAGALGAFVSALRRIYSFERILPVTKFRGLLRGATLYLVAYSSIPPLVGFIAAVVLYLVFASQLLQCELFPQFAFDSDQCHKFVDFMQNWKPHIATDYAKAIVWGFVAGFSERFVPDVLNRLSKESKS